MLSLADIDDNILGFRRAADDHALIDLGACRNEQTAALLRVIETVCDRLACLIGDQRTDRTALYIALIRLIFFKYGGHDALALGIGQEFALVAEEAAGRDQEFQTHSAALRMHLLHLTLAGAEFFHDGTDTVFRHVDRNALDRFAALAVDLFKEYARRRDSELIAFSSHIFNEDREVHFASACDEEGIRRFGIGNAQGNVLEQFLIEALAELAGCDKLALSACERAVIDRECHFDSRFADFREADRLIAAGCTDRITDVDAVDAGYPDNIADGRALRGDTLQLLNLKQRHELCIDRLLLAVEVADLNLLADLRRTADDSADTDSADIFIIVDRGDQHLQRLIRIALRRLDIAEDRIKERLEVFARLILRERCGTASAGAEEHRAFQLLIICIEVEQEL